MGVHSSTCAGVKVTILRHATRYVQSPALLMLGEFLVDQSYSYYSKVRKVEYIVKRRTSSTSYHHPSPHEP